MMVMRTVTLVALLALLTSLSVVGTSRGEKCKWGCSDYVPFTTDPTAAAVRGRSFTSVGCKVYDDVYGSTLWAPFIEGTRTANHVRD